MKTLGLSAVEIAPYNVFGTWEVDDDRVLALRSRIEDSGLVCSALQGILFDVPQAHLFESAESRRALADHLAKVARIARLLGARASVFGAPRQRDPGDLEPERAGAVAVEFLASVAPTFADLGTALAFEANARTYACRFVTTTREAIDLVTAVGRAGIALQIDMGTIFLEREDPAVLLDAAPLAAHAHVSEPGLQPPGSEGLDHAPLAAALKASGYSGYLSIEMRTVPDWENALSRAARLLHEEYL
ncbi:MAG TPA: sugar phosphate isomerase/epimerase [Allosphingosinicella sp.]